MLRRRLTGMVVLCRVDAGGYDGAGADTGPAQARRRCSAGCRSNLALRTEKVRSVCRLEALMGLNHRRQALRHCYRAIRRAGHPSRPRLVIEVCRCTSGAAAVGNPRPRRSDRPLHFRTDGASIDVSFFRPMISIRINCAAPRQLWPATGSVEVIRYFFAGACECLPADEAPNRRSLNSRHEFATRPGSDGELWVVCGLSRSSWRTRISR